MQSSGTTEGRDWTLIAEPLTLPAARAQGEEPVAWKPMRLTVRVAVARGVTSKWKTVRLIRASPG
jgi:hypothetical protein